MKLSWKLFFLTTPLFVVFLTIFGMWMIQSSFSGSLEQDVERCMTQNRMFQNSYELTWHSLSSDQQEQMTTERIVETFYQGDSEEDYSARILDADGTVLYEGGAVFATSGSPLLSGEAGGSGTLTGVTVTDTSGSLGDEENGSNLSDDAIGSVVDPDGDSDSVDSGMAGSTNLNNVENALLANLDEEQNVGYSLLREDASTYVLVICKSSIGIYIETVQDISSVFEARDAMYARYQVGVLAMSALVGGVTLLVLFVTMRNMQKLSKATRQFARGEYGTRVDIRSRDEIGMLAEDFNWMADEMSGQMEKLRDEVRRQEEFTSAFAHELKTPLTSIIGYADTIRQMELTPEETDMCANYIFQQGKRLQSLSYKLLEMTMAGNQAIERKAVRVPELFRDVELAVRAVLIEKSVKLQVEVEPGAVLGDKDLLSSVFINLIDNARKASQPGSRIWVTGVVLSERRGEYCLTVEDEAGGLPEEELSRITDAFYMVDKSRARKEGGAGLGLALCQKIIDAHQGSWRIENVPDQGLRVTVLLQMPQIDARERARERKRLQQKKTRSQV